MKRGRGRPRKGSEALGERRTIRLPASEDREIDAALAVEEKEFSEWARPLLVGGARKSIDKARKR